MWENKTETKMQTMIVLHHSKGPARAIWCPLMIRKHIAISIFIFNPFFFSFFKQMFCPHVESHVSDRRQT